MQLGNGLLGSASGTFVQAHQSTSYWPLLSYWSAPLNYNTLSEQLTFTYRFAGVISMVKSSNSR